MRDLYSIIGVEKNASDDDIKKAYRKLAKKLHPDMNPGNKEIEKKFKELSLAYDILGDEQKRKKYDRGLIDDQGNDRAAGFNYRPGRGGQTRGSERADPFANFDPQDIFADMFQSARRRTNIFGEEEQPAPPKKGADISYALRLSFLEAAKGVKRKISIGQNAKTIEVSIPPGTTDGQVLRLKGQGQPGGKGAPHGDALIEVHVDADPQYTVKQNDLYTDLPVTIYEAVLGASVTANTIDGKVNVTVPKNSNSGTTLRLKGKGLPDSKTKLRGDQYCRVIVHLPDKPDKKFTDWLESWAEKNPYRVRAED
jgi:DnaJ-class molecular chaperone